MVVVTDAGVSGGPKRFDGGGTQKGNDGCAGVSRLRNFSILWATTTLVAKAAGLLAKVMVSASVAVERKTVAAVRWRRYIDGGGTITLVSAVLASE